MGGRYEIRFYSDELKDCGQDYKTVHTNSWFEFMRIRLTKKVIYYTIRPKG